MEHFTPLRPDPATSLALALVATSQAPLLLLDEESRVVGASASFCSSFGIDPNSVNGIALALLGGGEWNVPQLTSLFRATLSGGVAIDCYEMDLVRPGEVEALSGQLDATVQVTDQAPGTKVSIVHVA